MAEIFDEITNLIIECQEDVSRVFHADHVKGNALKPVKVSGMSDLDLYTLISSEAERRYKELGITPNAVEFYKEVAKVGREIREKVPRQ
ncbi:hypothetical protein [Roseibium album]|uniref:hypothetical protein n=1 Tax=Roseibium album TaxID=311410 RepID=UPI00391BF218